MSDLISRELLLKEINNCRLQITGMRMGKGALRELLQQYIDHVNKTINAQPAAYDPEKIIKGLEELAERHPYKVPGKHETYCEYNMAWSDCIDAVEQLIDRTITT